MSQSLNQKFFLNLEESREKFLVISYYLDRIQGPFINYLQIQNKKDQQEESVRSDSQSQAQLQRNEEYNINQKFLHFSFYLIRSDNYENQQIDEVNNEESSPQKNDDIKEVQVLSELVYHDEENNKKKFKGNFTSEIESNFAFVQRRSKNNNNFLKLVMAKSYQTNFIQNLINKSYTKKLEQLTYFQRNILDDLQDQDEVYNDHDQEGFFHNALEFFRKCLNHFLAIKQYLNRIQLGVIDPVSRFVIFWDVFHLFTIILIFFWLPYKISFETQHIINLFNKETQTNSVEYALLGILISDVLVRCNMAIIQKGNIITLRSIIILNYFKKYAFVDFFSLLSVFFSLQIVSLEFYQQLPFQLILCFIFYILRKQKIEKILEKIQEFFNLNGSLNDMLMLIKMIVTLFLIGHIIACFWHGIAYFNPNYDTWLDFYNIRDADNVTKFNYSFYWATMTMTTVGYGDITPKNNIELLCANITMFVACGVFAFSVNSIGIVLQNLYKNKMEYSRTVTLINNYMHRNNIQFQLQTRIRSYLEYIWKEEKEMDEEEVSLVVSKLSSHLQDELQFELRGNIIQQCKVLSNNFSVNVQKKLVSYMEEIKFSPEELIIQKNQVDDCSLYMIAKGAVEIVFCNNNEDNNSYKTTKVLNKGDWFGEIAFFIGSPRISSLRSQGFTKLFKIRRDDFLDLLNQYPEDLERFYYIRDQGQIYQDYAKMKTKCFSCKSYLHQLNDCPVIHYQPDKERIIKKENFPYSHERQSKPRLRVKASAYKLQYQICQIIKEIQSQNNFYDRTHQSGTELEDISLHSNLVMPFEDDQKTHTLRSLSRVSQLPQQEESDDQFFVRNNNQKQTIRTAGFGQMTESLKLTNLIEENAESEESSSGDDDPQDDVISSSPRNQIIKQRTSQPRVTFIDNFQNFENDVIIPQRQNSSRSLTYNSKNHQTPSENQFSNQRQKSIDRSSSFHKNKSIEMPSVKHTQSDNIIDKPENDDSASSFKMQRSLIKRKSTKTNTRLSVIIRDDLPETGTHQSQTNQYNNEDDKMHIFSIYFPLNNYDIVIKRYAKLQKYFGKKRIFADTSVYSFNFMAIKKGAKLRRALEKKDILLKSNKFECKSQKTEKDKDRKKRSMRSSRIESKLKEVKQLN